MTSLRTSPRRTLAVLLAALATHAHAEGERQLAEVTAVDQRDAQAQRKNLAVQKIIVSEEEVERYGDATVGDVLRRLPGMSFTGPAGVAKDVRMRGLEKGYTLFLINGEPVPTATKDRQIQVDRLPADMIERIEIIRNPSAAHDADGIGGAINIVLKNRADDLTRLRAAWGRNGDMKVGDVVAQTSRRIGDLDIVLAASHTVGAEDVVEDKEKLNAAGAVTEREFKPKPVEKTETLLAPRLTWRLGEDRLTFEPFVSSGTEDKVESSEFRNPAGAYTKGTAKTENKDDTVARIAGRYDGRTAWGSWFAKAGAQEARIDKRVVTRESNAAGVQGKLSTENEDITDRNTYLGGGFETALGERHRISSGLEWRDSEFDNRKKKTENGADKTAVGDLFNIEEQRLIAWLQDEWRLAGAHWLTPGLRLERIARDAVDGNGRQRSSTVNASNPSLHYRWAARDDLNVRASLARTVKLPKFDQVNPLVTLATGSNSGLNPDKGGNTDLKPETAVGIEVGVEKYFWGNRGVIGVNLYDRRVDDFIQKETRSEGGRFVERPYNAAEAHFYGVELDWRLPLLRKGPHDLTLIGNHAELRGRVLNIANGAWGEVKDMPPRTSQLGIDWRHRPSQWTGGFSVGHQPAFTTDGINADGVREVKWRNASTLLDLYAGKAWGPRAELRLIAKNVLSVRKSEATAKYKADGSFESGERKTERSRPTIYLTFESRF